MEWALIVMAFAGVFSDSDSVALTNIPMYSQAMCEAAGKKAKSLGSGTKKEVNFVCVKVR